MGSLNERTLSIVRVGDKFIKCLNTDDLDGCLDAFLAMKIIAIAAKQETFTNEELGVEI